MKAHLRLSDEYGVFQYNPLDRFVAGWGSKGAFVGKVRCVYRSQTWNKAGQRYAVSRMIPDPLVEKKTGSHYWTRKKKEVAPTHPPPPPTTIQVIPCWRHCLHFRSLANKLTKKDISLRICKLGSKLKELVFWIIVNSKHFPDSDWLKAHV